MDDVMIFPHSNDCFGVFVTFSDTPIPKNSKHSNSCWPQKGFFSHDTATFLGDDQAGRDDQTLVSRERLPEMGVYTSIFVHHHQIIIAFNFFQVTSWIMIELWSETMWNRVDWCILCIPNYYMYDMLLKAGFITTSHISYTMFFSIPFTPVFLKT